jgi:hypothetical protein
VCGAQVGICRVNHFLIAIVGVGIQVGPLDTAATNMPIVAAPGDYDDGEIGEMIERGNPKYTGKSCPSVALSTTNPTCCPDVNPGLCGGKPATNRLSYRTGKTYVE